MIFISLRNREADCFCLWRRSGDGDSSMLVTIRVGCKFGSFAMVKNRICQT